MSVFPGVLRSKFVKFLMSILKRQVNSSSIFVSFFIVTTHNSSGNFKVIHFLLWTKGSHQSPNFDTFKCSGENLPNSSCHFSNHMSVFPGVLRSKFVKFLMSILKRQVNSSSIFVSFFIVTTHNSSGNFKVIHFLLWTKGSHQSPNFDTFKCSGENLPNSSCHFSNHMSVFPGVLRSKFVKFLMSILKRQVNSSSIFVSFFIVTTHNSSGNFKVIHFLLWTKGSHQSPNFDTFKCSGENLPNSSCHFSNLKSVFLQILHHSSVS